ncbi:ammonia-forming cytochrome c nitrite reductase subunit c552 [Paraferrimonas haliotis]|uniref:nitrite reductase (cytochrome; ammonia-forming) n=1 Tax=Paraferrimonas haliotis TaxID=2013866 RepID=A0AA37TN40_9GAMM|nr:ammonia-forming cytochrome c nitrite reductase subunit c552 [Paraferrimonas haliotis]GLS84517.1 cytochrome c-552 [Paraferrimonas haliotis]
MKLQKLAIAIAVSAVLVGCNDDDGNNVTCGDGSTLNPDTNICEVNPIDPPVECGDGTVLDPDSNTCVIPPSTGPVDFYNSDNWAKDFPAQHASWAETVENTPADGLDDLLAANPALVTAWAGYGFAKDYNRARGHHFALTDVIKSLRTGHPMVDENGAVQGEAMAASCWSCKSPDTARLYDEIGEANFADNSWSTWGHEMANTIGCADCHELGDDTLRLSRPHTDRATDLIGRTFAAASDVEKANQTCAQCHVEYYFDGSDSKKVKYPWDYWKPAVDTDYADVVDYKGSDGLYQGFTAEAQLAYYDYRGFKDWTNAISGAAMLKAQHPEYENLEDRTTHTMSSHLDFGCSTCHMPKAQNSEGQEYSAHNVRFDMNKMPSSCQSCHDADAMDSLLKARKAEINDLRFGANGVDPMLNEVHFKAQAIWSANGVEGLVEGKTIGQAKANYEGALQAGNVLADEMNSLLTKVRNAQWFWDSATASHGIHAHNPAEAKRLLNKANGILVDAIAEADALLVKYNSTFVYDAANYDSKAKVQPLAGLDLKGMQDAKADFIENRVETEWPVDLK